MKRSPLILALLLFCGPVFCQDMPSDVPEDHYAYDAIYDLVERGINVSQGYPDGTFQGNRNTTRYENAYLMASLALSMKRDITGEIDVSDIREEISYVRDEMMKVKEQPEIKGPLNYSGSIDFSSKFGSIFAYEQNNRAPLGPETNYRLKYSVEKRLGDDASLKMNIDTMDGGFNSQTARPFPLSIMDIEGNLTTDMGLENPVRMRAIVGPGSVRHTDISGIAASENNTYFSRPRPTFIVGTKLSNYDVDLGYAARSIKKDGTVGLSEIYLQLGRKMEKLPTIGTLEVKATSRFAFIDFMSPSSAPNDFRQEITLLTKLSSKTSEKMTFGISSTDSPQSQFYFNWEIYMKDFSGHGTDANFIFNSVGADYRLPFEDLEFIPTNIFNKKILDGTVDIGVEAVQRVSKTVTLRARTDWVANSKWEMGKKVPGSSFTKEISVDYEMSRGLLLNAFYRYFYVPSRLDQFGGSVPEFSDIVGIGLDYRF